MYLTKNNRPGLICRKIQPTNSFQKKKREIFTGADTTLILGRSANPLINNPGIMLITNK